MSKLLTTHLILNAPVEDVWAILTDLPDYSSWNPFITAAAGTLGVGERLDLTVQPPHGRGKRFKPWVTALERHHYIEWLGRLALPGILDGRHSLTLTPMSRDRTLLQQSTSFTGVLIPFTGLTLVRMRAGLVAMNRALAQRTTGQRGSDPPSPATGHQRREPARETRDGRATSRPGLPTRPPRAVSSCRS